MRGVRLWGALALAAIVGGPTVARGQLIASSTFDAGTEGWENGDFFAASGAGAPTFLAAGGNPGGFIRVNDSFGWNALQAPAAFLGNQSAAYGGSIRLDTRIASGDGPVCPLVVLGDGATTLMYRAPQPASGVWTSYLVPLLASAGWEISNQACSPGVAATELQLQTVLGNLGFLNVNADWQTGGDQVDLDNVLLVGPSGLPVPGVVPEPATVALVAAGLLALGAAARRRGAA